MKTGYRNGERVYVLDSGNQIGRTEHKWNTVQVFRHRDIVRALNRLLREAGRADDEAMNGDPFGLGFVFWSLIHALAQSYCRPRVPSEIIDEEMLLLDDEGRIKNIKLPRVRNAAPAGKKSKFKVLLGGRYGQEARL